MNAADDQKVREVVENIINHPSFRASLSNILNNSCDQSSRGRAPIFQRGISHRQSARARRRAANVPYTRGSDSNRHRKREIFRSKEVILLPNSKTDRIVWASEKASLMERGLVLNEVMIDKNWSDKEVFQYLDECFKEKLSSESFSSVDVGGTSISTRYAFCFVCRLRPKKYLWFQLRIVKKLGLVGQKKSFLNNFFMVFGGFVSK